MHDIHQRLQYVNDGKAVLDDVPVPLVRSGHQLIHLDESGDASLLTCALISFQEWYKRFFYRRR